MSEDRKSASLSESLVLDDSEKGIVLKGITDDTVAAKSGLQAEDEIVAATIHLDNLDKNEVLNILKVLQPYENNMKVLTKKDLSASAGLGSLGLGLKDSAEQMLPLKDLSLDTSADAPAVSLDGLSGKLNAAQGLGGKINGLTLNGDLPSLSLNQPSADAGATFAMPKAGVTGPDIKSDLGGTVKAPDVSVSTPKINTPSASLDVEKPEIKTGNMKYKPPKFRMPHFHLPQLKTPKAEMDVSGDADLPSVSGNVATPDLSLPKVDLESSNLDLNGPKVDLNSPDVNFETPNVDIDASSGKIKWPHQKWKGPKVKGPDGNLNADLHAPDVSLSTPKVDGDLSAPDVDINLPKADIKGPDLDVQTPDLDIDSSSGKIHWPWKWKKTKLDASLNTPDVDGDINLPKADLKGPDIDVNAPGVDIDGHSGKINWPHLKWKKPKLHGPKADLDIDADLNTPDLNLSAPKGDINVPNAELNLPKADLEGPDVDVNVPHLDIDGHSGKINWPHLKWKKPKLHGPKADMDINADLSTPDVDLSLPKADGEISTPDVDLSLPKPDAYADIEPPSGKIRFPTMKMPKFKLSGPKVKGPEVDLDADVKAPDLSLSPEGPKLDINSPDVDAETPRFNLFKKLKFGTLKGPKADIDADVKVPDVDFKGPAIDGGIEPSDLNISMPNADVKGLDVDLNGPDADLESGKLKLPKFKLLKLKGPKVKGPELDADLKAPDIDASVDIPKVDADAPNLDLDVPDLDIHLPEADLKGPEVDATPGKFTLSKLKALKFGLSGPRVKGPNLDVNTDLKSPKADLTPLDVNLNTPDIDASLGAPKVKVDAPNVDMNVSDLSLSASKTEAPDLDINLPKAAPDVDIQTPEFESSAAKFKLPKLKLPSLSGPKVKGTSLDVDPDVDLSLPDVDGMLPKADLTGPDVNVKAPDWNLSASQMKGDLSTPDLDLDTDLKSDIDLSAFLSAPEIKGPGVDLDLPKTDVKGSSLDLEKPDLEAPNLNLSSPKINGSLSAPNIDAKLPKAELEAPDVTVKDLKGPDAQLKTPDLGLDSHLGDFKMPHFKLPKLDLSSPEVEVPSVNPLVDARIEAPRVNIDTPTADANISVPAADLSAPKLKGDIKGPEIDVKTPDVDANLEKSKLSHFKFPKFGFLGSKTKSPEVNASANLEEGSGADSETDLSNAEVEVPAFKFHRLPRNSIDDIGGIADTFSLSKIDTESKDYVVSKGIRLPIVNAASKVGEKIDIMQRLKMAKEKAPSTNVSPTEEKTGIDLKLATPSLDASALTEVADTSLVRGGTFKVEKPDSVLGLAAPEISTSEENNRLSLGLSNMLGLNIKESDGN